MQLTEFSYRTELEVVPTIILDGHAWITVSGITQIFNTTQQNISHHISNLEALGQFKERVHTITLPITRTEGKRTVTRLINHYSEIAVMRIGQRVNTAPALAFQEWAVQMIYTLKKEGAVYDDNDATKRLNALLDELGVPRFAMGGLLGRVTHLAGLATAARKRKPTTSLTTTNESTTQNIIALAHSRLDEVGTPIFARPNETERLAERLIYLAALAKGQLKEAKALLMEPAPNYEYIASEVMRILSQTPCEDLARIGFDVRGYKNNGFALYPDLAYKHIIKVLAREGKHIPHPNTIWRALMKTGKLARFGKEKGRMPWLTRTLLSINYQG